MSAARVYDPFFERAAHLIPPAAHPTPPGCADTAALSLPGSGDRAAFSQSCQVELSEAVMILLGAIALHDGYAVPALIGRWAEHRSAEIGLGVLARAVFDQSDCAVSTIDLTDVPEFERSGKTRFGSGGGP